MMDGLWKEMVGALAGAVLFGLLFRNWYAAAALVTGTAAGLLTRRLLARHREKREK